MGIIKQGILGGFKNKVGVVIGSSWKGIAVMRAMPLSVANPRTTAQVKQRTNFGEMASFGSKILSTIQRSYNPIAKYKSGFNLWLQQNLAILKASSQTFWEQTMQLSYGELSCSLTGASVHDGALHVSWDTDLTNPKDKDDDKLQVFAVTIPSGAHTIADIKIANLTKAGVTRDTGTEPYSSSGLLQGRTNYVKAFFISNDGKEFSNTASATIEFLAE